MDSVEFLGFTLLTRDISRLDRYSTQQIQEEMEPLSRSERLARVLVLVLLLLVVVGIHRRNVGYFGPNSFEPGR